MDRQRSEKKRGLRVLFAPDFRHLVQYQQLLAAALADQEVTVEFMTGYRRLLPMYRGLRGRKPDIFHQHFPVFYIMRNHPWDPLRKARFFGDVFLTARVSPLVYTVHDLYPTSHNQDAIGRAGMHYLLRKAAALIVHSEEAKRQVLALGGVRAERCAVIPHGDLSVPMGQPVARETARLQLGLAEEKVCLALGILTPNKGIEELIAYWKRENPGVVLLIAGHAHDAGYAQKLNMLVSGVPDIRLRFGFLSDYDVKLHLCATDCVVLNYRTIFTSGVASLARAYGVPTLLPTRLKTVDVHEPHRSVIRFDALETDFAQRLVEALARGTDYAAAQEWRDATAWDVIAARTREVYDSVARGS